MATDKPNVGEAGSPRSSSQPLEITCTPFRCAPRTGRITNCSGSDSIGALTGSEPYQ